MGNEKQSYTEIMELASKNKKIEEFNDILDNYFTELEQYHPQTYVNLMRELNKLTVPVNIEDETQLKEYLGHIKHEDTPTFWTVDETTKVAEDIGIDFNKWIYNKYTFNFVMNMIRADYYDEFKSMFNTSPLMKQSIVDSASFYAHMAKAWLNDEDAPSDKTMKYIHHIVLGEE